jgi:integrase
MSTKVWLEVTGGTLRAIWRYNGKPEKLSLDLPNDKLGRVVAERRIAEIRADLISNTPDRFMESKSHTGEGNHS